MVVEKLQSQNGCDGLRPVDLRPAHSRSSANVAVVINGRLLLSVCAWEKLSEDVQITEAS